VNAGNWISLLTVVITLVTTIGGWSVGHLLTRLRTADALVSTQRDTIEDLRRQVQRLEITAELTDKFLTQLPRPATGKGRA
jgi:hypothetical protein